MTLGLCKTIQQYLMSTYINTMVICTFKYLIKGVISLQLSWDSFVFTLINDFQNFIIRKVKMHQRFAKLNCNKIKQAVRTNYLCKCRSIVYRWNKCHHGFLMPRWPHFLNDQHGDRRTLGWRQNTKLMKLSWEFGKLLRKRCYRKLLLCQ